ncbi:helix-turn-helix domain-containing protein [Microbacterium sp. Au-Mic1]|uniref:helix-turn-helix transcriptional regulator n=1 Tax=Microbacterium sp. Au-Mic1 TaxID=2906457 RepID=UPI001E57EDEE|nr:helix-turn-helix domain-containing protein [Microbacterium sp. Au-Mic1]MCE4026211.1 helix-turn-helix domain-containing protein [Microbacterium sp. Au-Mic1]
MEERLGSAGAFAAFVRRARLRAGMTQEDLAQAVRKSRHWVHDVEASKVTPSLGAAIDVAAALRYEILLRVSERSAVLDQVFEDLDMPSDI